MKVEIRSDKNIKKEDIIALYEANEWSSAQKPEMLFNGLMNSHSLISAWNEDQLIGLGNAISDGHLVVYYPHLLIHPDYHGHGIGRMIMDRFKERYGNFHQQILVSDGKTIGFYQKCGFEIGGDTQSMWIYQGDEH